MSDFIVGQRWISNTEAELGLGIVSKTDHRLVTISYPAAAEQRVYAADNAPLTRVTYRVGDQVYNNDQSSMTIRDWEEIDGYITYSGIDERQQHISWGEIELDCFVQFSKAQDRLFAGQIDKNSEFQLRQQALDHQQRLSDLSTTGLIGPRIQLLQHQLYIAYEVGCRFAPRVLLADEVGLGKTIEAGLVLHQQLLRGLAQRVLIVVPESLVHQWLVEMLRRFNLHFMLLDEERALALQESGSNNPFESEQLVLCSVDFIAENPERQDQALASQWDICVMDEAHHLEWHPEQPSSRYLVAEQLSRVARGLLLLTATPEQVGADSHFARLRLLDPDRFYDLQDFVNEQNHYSQVNELVQQLRSGKLDTDDSALIQAVHSLLGTAFDWQQELKSTCGRQRIIDELLDRHGTGRVLFRNTRHNVSGFPKRKLHRHCVNATDDQQLPFACHNRVDWLVGWLKQHRQEKVLLICSQRDLAQDLEMHLNLRCGVRSAVFHEGLSLIERDRAAAYFAQPEDGAQILVCSEIGSEGRNFQFAHHLILFDLPTNPDLIEQRIGRLDRIGQTENVCIHVPYLANSQEEALLDWLHRGLNCLESVCPVGNAVFEQFQQPLQQCLQQIEEDPESKTTRGEFEYLIETTSKRTQALLDELQRGRDQLLELNSCKPEVALKLIEELQGVDDDTHLREFMELAVDVYGVDYETQADGSVIMHPSDHMQCDHFPGLPNDGLTAIFDRNQALSREDLHFLTWEHPMVAGVMDMIISSQLGNASVCTLSLPPLKPGTVLIEALFVFSCAAPKSLQITRYIDNACLRLLCDNDRRSLGHIVSADHINRLCQPLKRAKAAQVIQHTRVELQELVAHLEAQALAEQGGMIAKALESAEQSYAQELQRMKSLAEVNPNIRQEELEHLEQQAQQCKLHLNQGRIRLDALRVILIT